MKRDTDSGIRADLDELLDLPVTPEREGSSTLLVGRVEDTHQPQLPGRLLVRWRDDAGASVAAWLPYVRGTDPRANDRVLLGRPGNEPGWIITGVLERSAPRLVEHPRSEDAVERLQAGQRLRVEAHDGTALIEVGSDDGDVFVRLLASDVSLATPGRLRLAGRSVEIDAGTDGVDVRTEKDVVVRGRTIRLN